MTATQAFRPLHTELTPPAQFNWPFHYEPHPLALLAASQLQQELAGMALGSDGKMFGVMVVRRADDQLGFLAAYSGLLCGRNDWPGFVPPVYDAQQPDGHFKQTERIISDLNGQLQRLAADSPEAQSLGERRRELSEELQQWLFRQYRLMNGHGEAHNLVEVWQDYHCSARIRKRYPLPPGGTGDCCAPKLLQYAYLNRLQPLCMAEFWWGPSPKSEVRHHLRFYPACRGKCKPVLTWMMQGLDVEPDPELKGFPPLDIRVVYEDDWLLIIDKPSGLLSIPGRSIRHSVATIVHERYPQALLVHRLDLGTSGLLLVAKSRQAHLPLQKQFEERSISKTYVALLESMPAEQRGRIDLPLLCDPLNRPRQVIDFERGKPATTDYEVIGTREGQALVALHPLTGRTHQLRVHCAHQLGLGCPIVGDELYGHHAHRLCLHAARLEFTHPATGQRVSFESPAPFA